MLNAKMNAVREVTELLVALEAQVDQAMVTRARLETALIENRRKARLPLDAGLDGLEKVAAMASALATARSAVSRAHYDLRDVRDAMRLPIHAYGDAGDTPSAFEPTGAAARLSVVAA